MYTLVVMKNYKRFTNKDGKPWKYVFRDARIDDEQIEGQFICRSKDKWLGGLISLDEIDYYRNFE